MPGQQTDAGRSVGVVGAGIAGLAAAQHLSEQGHRVHVFDKGRSVGGRLATRRIGDATVDHGAQFFTVRTPAFDAAVRAARDAGLAYEWCRGFGAVDGYPRYAIRGGMNRLAKHLAAGLDVGVDTLVESVERGPRGWDVRHGGRSTPVDAVVLTPPVPQSLALIDAGGAAVLDAPLRTRLDAIAYHPTLALLVVLDGPSGVPSPGGVQLDDGPFSFIADNGAKGISDQPALTFHASHALSRDLWDADADGAQAELLAHAQAWFGRSAATETQLKRWRYAQPTAPLAHDVEATTVDGAPLVFAGDAFAGAKVEGAYRSGRAAAASLGSLWAVGS